MCPAILPSAVAAGVAPKQLQNGLPWWAPLGKELAEATG
jgi:hypothetical protein